MNETQLTGLVECGACSTQLIVTRHEWYRTNGVICPCGEWADLEFARRHASWDEVSV